MEPVLFRIGTGCEPGAGAIGVVIRNKTRESTLIFCACHGGGERLYLHHEMNDSLAWLDLLEMQLSMDGSIMLPHD
jgi:hypothetical protein